MSHRIAFNLIRNGRNMTKVLSHSTPISTNLTSFRNLCFKNITEDADNEVNTMTDVKRKVYGTLGSGAYTPLKKSREHLVEYEPKSLDELVPRSMKDSFTTAIIPLSTNSKVRQKYITFLNSIRFGRLMEDMDLFAVIVVHKHIKLARAAPDGQLPYTLVTVLVDKIDFTDLVPKHDQDIRLSGHVTWVGKSSIEVVVWLDQKIGGKWEKLTRALFLMGARNSLNTKASLINPLVASNEEEKKILIGGEDRKQRRMIIQKESVLQMVPTEFEHKLIHDMFVNSIDLGRKAINRRKLPLGSVWMEDATMSNILFSHPEDSNAHNTVFGGYLMRNAYELSFALAYNYTNRRPKIEHISDIMFHRAVAVSSAIKMMAHLLYTEQNYMEIVVVAEVFDPKSGDHTTTNVFYYTFSNVEKVPQIFPRTYHEAMWYLDGRRRFRSAVGLSGAERPDIPHLEDRY